MRDYLMTIRFYFFFNEKRNEVIERCNIAYLDIIKKIFLLFNKEDCLYSSILFDNARIVHLLL